MQPTTGGETAPARWPRAGCALFALGFTLVIGGLFGYVAYALYQRSQEAPKALETVLRPTPSVIVAVQKLAVLQTSAFHLERVIDLRDRQNHLFGLVRGEDAILLVAAGDVTAGVDLSELREADVEVDAEAHSVHLHLPPVKILSATLDNRATYVHTRRTDPLAKREETLETRARQEAERTLREAALAGGILTQAREGTERTLKTLLGSLGFEHVTLSFRKE